MMMNNRIKIIITLLVVVMMSVTIWFGFGQTSAVIDSCYATSTTYVTAEYSETVCSFDEDGYSSCSTNYWSSKASPRWSVSTLNGELQHVRPQNQKENVYLSNGFYTLPIPPRDESHTKRFDFDRFKNHRDNDIRINLIRVNGEKDHVTEPDHKYPSCLVWREKGLNIKLKTWYGISFSVEDWTE